MAELWYGEMKGPKSRCKNIAIFLVEIILYSMTIHVANEVRPMWEKVMRTADKTEGVQVCDGLGDDGIQGPLNIYAPRGDSYCKLVGSNCSAADDDFVDSCTSAYGHPTSLYFGKMFWFSKQYIDDKLDVEDVILVREIYFVIFAIMSLSHISSDFLMSNISIKGPLQYHLLFMVQKLTMSFLKSAFLMMMTNCFLLGLGPRSFVQLNIPIGGFWIGWVINMLILIYSKWLSAAADESRIPIGGLCLPRFLLLAQLVLISIPYIGYGVYNEEFFKFVLAEGLRTGGDMRHLSSKFKLLSELGFAGFILGWVERALNLIELFIPTEDE